MKTNKYQGFSILGTSIVLVVLAIAGAGLLTVYSESSDHARWTESQAKLKMVKKALIQFSKRNKYLPCPSTSILGDDSRASGVTINFPAIPATVATPAVPGTATAPTIPAIPSTDAQTAIPNVPVATCSARSGNVPFQALGLSRADVTDGFGNMFTYAVDGGVTNGLTMMDCPTQTACFFNSSPLPADLSRKGNPNVTNDLNALPWFDLSTLPNKGALGPLNLRICTDEFCGSLVAEGQIAVLVAHNRDDASNTIMEVANTDVDADFISAEFSKTPRFDDLVLGISANDIKERIENESFEEFVDVSGTNTNTQTGTDVGGLGDGTVGSNGTNVGTDAAVAESNIQTFNFGAEAANEEVVLKFDTKAVGGWEDAAYSSTAFDDRGGVYVNQRTTKIEEFSYSYIDEIWDDVEQHTLSPPIEGFYRDMWNEDKTWNSTYTTAGVPITFWQPVWFKSYEHVVTLDGNGELEVEFEVQSTATGETIGFSDIEIIKYNTPSQVENFPAFPVIVGIPQTKIEY